nr:capsular biosynthesis protein [uncultured Achromobacter sp.]
MKRIIMDLDDTICRTVNGDYRNATPIDEVVIQMRKYKELGFEIAISTSRNMRTYGGNLGKINANTLPIIIEWLDRHGVPYDEIYSGKPWCGTEGFYVDDRAIRPDEFARLSYGEVRKLTGIE